MTSIYRGLLGWACVALGLFLFGFIVGATFAIVTALGAREVLASLIAFAVGMWQSLVIAHYVYRKGLQRIEGAPRPQQNNKFERLISREHQPPKRDAATSEIKRTKQSPEELTYDLDDVISILRRARSDKLYEPRKVRSLMLDHFLYSGRFNSVLGPDGFKVFKKKLGNVVDRVNKDQFGSNFINLDQMYEALLDSGVYYVDDALPEELSWKSNRSLKSE